MSDNKNTKIWNDVKSDLVAGVVSFSSGITFSDIMNDGDSKLICGDVNSKLKVFKKECLVSDSRLQYCPCSITKFISYDKTLKSNVELLAVAGAQYIFIYKKMKGTFKLVIPNIEINSLELQIWDDLKNNKMENQKAIDKLKDMASESKLIFIIRNSVVFSVFRTYKS